MAGFTRRDLLVLGGIAAAMFGWQSVMRRTPELAFEPLRAAPGWQFASAGEVSALSGSDFMTLGLQNAPDPLPLDRLPQVVHRDAKSETVPVAVYSDFFCPYCRTLIGRLNARNSGVPISVSWHELPLLGQNSVLVANAAEAAALQGGYAVFYRQLLADGFRPSVRWLGQIADKAGLDGSKLLADMDGPEVAARLSESAASAAQLGFFATPGLVIGQRAVLGALEADQLETLIKTTPRTV